MCDASREKARRSSGPLGACVTKAIFGRGLVRMKKGEK